jgi:membrane-bound serine protease (ClpP class)
MVIASGRSQRRRVSALLVALAAALAGALLLSADRALAQDSTVLRTSVDGVITPVMADHLADAVAEAETQGYEALVVTMDTPGGVLDSTRDIVQTFLTAEVPVVVYVSPAGASAASAGAIITFSSHVAAMAPGTNIGAATPVDMEGGEVIDKVVEDAAAYVAAIAEERGRDVDFAVETVREGRSAPVSEAVEVGAVDLSARTF